MARTNGFDFDEYTNIGNILLRRKSLTSRQLQRAVDHQGGQKLGDVVVDLGLCTRAEVDAAMSEQRSARGINGSDAVERARATMRAAISRVGTQTKRLAKHTTLIEIPISPENA